MSQKVSLNATSRNKLFIVGILMKVYGNANEINLKASHSQVGVVSISLIRRHLMMPK